MFRPDRSVLRRFLAVAIVCLLAPTVVAGAGQLLDGSDAVAGPSVGHDVEDLTLVTAQGRSPKAVADPGGIELVNTTSKERVWAHDSDRCMRYYDAEPIDDSTLLITANCRIDDDYRMRLAFQYDWRDGEYGRIFRIPGDAHDVDRLGPHTYAVADIQADAAYVYNYTDDSVVETTFRGHEVRGSVDQDHVWRFDFREDHPWPGNASLKKNHTHLNDVDAVDGGSAFLLSPRNYNRVLLVDRETKTARWTLGEQDAPLILHGQHHPVLLDDDPATVLVGDSLNHRVVEYRRTDSGEWELVWSYGEGLNWPRAVDRLPNGNTLIMDTGNDRALEVTPNGTVAWEYDTMQNPFDVERYAHGDEPDGPTMAQLRGDGADVASGAGEPGGLSILGRLHRLAGFVLPVWIGRLEFAALAGAAVTGIAWSVAEAGLAVRRRR